MDDMAPAQRKELPAESHPQEWPFEAARAPLPDETRRWIAGKDRPRRFLNPDFAALALPVKE